MKERNNREGARKETYQMGEGEGSFLKIEEWSGRDRE